MQICVFLVKICPKFRFLLFQVQIFKFLAEKKVEILVLRSIFVQMCVFLVKICPKFCFFSNFPVFSLKMVEIYVLRSKFVQISGFEIKICANLCFSGQYLCKFLCSSWNELVFRWNNCRSGDLLDLLVTKAAKAEKRMWQQPTAAGLLWPPIEWIHEML